MFGSTTLEVAIGLVFLFFILSLIVSAAREMLEGWLQSRAAHLERGIRELLKDETGEGLARQIYQHPLIASLYTGEYDPKSQLRSAATGRKDPWRRVKFGSNLPAYIPARNFAAALLDLSARGPAEPGKVDAQAVSFERIRAGVAEHIPNERVQRAVLIALDQAKGDLEQARANLEAWYDSGMDRVSGWYRKNTQWILFAMGLVLAVALNIDTIRIARSLYEDEGMRAVVVAEAEAAVEAAHATKGESTDAEALRRYLGCPDGGARQGMSCAQTRLADLGLPMGWNAHVWPWQLERTELPRAFGLFLVSLAGWLLSALALTLGAPFWFDLLNKIMIIRSTVKPHEKSPEEASEDRQRPERGGARGAGS